MAENINNIDTIEAFLRGKLNGSELGKFEQQLNADPNLQNEVEFQKTIQDGLFEARRLELKQRLNNITIEPAFEWTIGKVAAGVAIFGLIGLGAYSLLHSSDEKIVVQKPKTQQSEIVIDNSPQQLEKKSAPVESIIQTKQPIAKNTVVKERSKAVINQSVEDVVHSVDVLAPAIPVEHGHHHVEKHADGTTPNGKIEQVGAINISSLSVDIEKSKDQFHYKYFGEKLVLVGDFSKGPYELIELNKNQEKNLYLFYDGSFYELHYGTKNLDPLVKIVQSKLIKELKHKIKK